MTFDADTYWQGMGAWLAGPGAATPEHVIAERELALVLRDLDRVDSVLDVGCGRGRLAALLAEVMPKAAYSGVDLGSQQIRATQEARLDATLYESRIQDFEPSRAWDLVLCSEVLMHVPPADIEAVCDKLKRLAKRWIVAVEWSEPLDEPIADWNWLYDYPSLLGPIYRTVPIGLQSIFVIRR